MPAGFHPGGMPGNSPTLQRWGRPIRYLLSPEGTAEGVRVWSAVPSGLMQFATEFPTPKAFGVGLLSHVPLAALARRRSGPGQRDLLLQKARTLAALN